MNNQDTWPIADIPMAMSAALAFLQTTMNDREWPLALRVTAAQALVQAADIYLQAMMGSDAIPELRAKILQLEKSMAWMQAQKNVDDPSRGRGGLM